MNLDELLELALKAGERAGAAIVASKKDLKIWQKDDGSPFSSADLAANEAICEVLAQSGIAICSEERILPFAQRKQMPYFWLIDPLDGTKGFLKGSDEYCILIALIHEQRPILALIHQPEKKSSLYAHAHSKLYKNGSELQINKEFFIKNEKKALISVHHPNAQNKAFLEENKLKSMQISSALKFNALCEGVAGVYARFESLHSWDIAAGDFLLNHAGGLMCDFHQKPLLYNQESFLCPPFIALSRKEFFKDFKF